MKKILIVFGTRPEAIKMAPLVKELKSRSKFDVRVCTTGQHKEMLKQVLDIFDIAPDYELDIMKKQQDLYDITANILVSIKRVLKEFKPDVVLVHGDTSTTFSVALASYYEKIPVGHVEAGLRTGDIYSPFPEEFNRLAVGNIASLHFAPTKEAARNLINEGKDKNSIYITGNTAIDALSTTVQTNFKHPELEWAKDSRMILVTAHRRENLGEPLVQIFNAIKHIVTYNKNVKIIFPVHLNPQVSLIANELLGDTENIHLVKPLDVTTFHNFINASYFIMSDSGGIQEEAPSLGKPVLVLRDTTERPEGIKAGTLKLVGTNKDKIINEATKLLDNSNNYKKMSEALNPFGDGTASKQIADILENI